MGYCVISEVYVGVIVDEKLYTEAEKACSQVNNQLKTEISIDSVGEGKICIYSQTLNSEQWGHSAYFNDIVKTDLGDAKGLSKVLELLNVAPQKPQLILKMNGG